MRTIEELSPCELEKIAALKRLASDLSDKHSYVRMFPQDDGDVELRDALWEGDMNRIKEFICGVIEYRIKEVAK